MLLYQVNGWKTGKKRSTELHSLFYQCSYIVLKQTSKQTKSFGAFLNWKAVLSWRASLNCGQNRGEKKDRKLPKSKARVLLKARSRGKKRTWPLTSAWSKGSWHLTDITLQSGLTPSFCQTVDPGLRFICMHWPNRFTILVSAWIRSCGGHDPPLSRWHQGFLWGRTKLLDTGSLRVAFLYIWTQNSYNRVIVWASQHE